MCNIQHHRHACHPILAQLLSSGWPDSIKNCSHLFRSAPVPALASACRAVDTFTGITAVAAGNAADITLPSGLTPHHCVSSDCSSVRSQIPALIREMQDSSLALRITDNGGQDRHGQKPPGGRSPPQPYLFATIAEPVLMIEPNRVVHSHQDQGY